MSGVWIEIGLGRKRFVTDAELDKMAAEPDKRSDLPCPRIMPDIPAYKSPLGDGLIIEGRAARREHLKRNGCREVDPSEWATTSKAFKETRAQKQAEVDAMRAARAKD